MDGGVCLKGGNKIILPRPPLDHGGSDESSDQRPPTVTINIGLDNLHQQYDINY